MGSRIPREWVGGRVGRLRTLAGIVFTGLVLSLQAGAEEVVRPGGSDLPPEAPAE